MLYLHVVHSVYPILMTAFISECKGQHGSCGRSDPPYVLLCYVMSYANPLKNFRLVAHSLPIDVTSGMVVGTYINKYAAQMSRIIHFIYALTSCLHN